MGRTVETVFRFRNDASATNQVLRDESRIRKAADEVANAEKRKAAAATRAEKDMLQAYKKVKKEAEAARKAAEREAAERKAIYGDLSSRTSSFGGLASGLGNTGLASRLMIVSDLLDSVEAAKLLGPEMGRLAGQMNLTRGKVIGLSLVAIEAAASAVLLKDALDELNAANEKATQVVQGHIAGLKQYYDFIGAATSTALQEEVDAVAKRQATSRQYYADLQELQTQLTAGLEADDTDIVGRLAEGALRAYDALGGNVAGLEDLDKALSQTQTSIESDTLYLNLLTTAFVDGATAANDAAQRERDYTNAKLADLNRRAQQEISTAALIETATSDQIESRLNAIDAEQTAYANLLAQLSALPNQTDETAARIEELGGIIFTLSEEETNFKNNVLPLVAAREAETQALKDLDAATAERKKTLSELGTVIRAANQAERDYQAARNDAAATMQSELQRKEDEYRKKRLAAVEDFERDRMEREADYQRDRAADLADHLKSVEDIQEKSQQRIADLYKEYQKTVAKLQADARKDIKKEEDDYNKSRLRALKDYQRDQEQRERGHRQNLASAALRLDAIAIYEEQQRYKEEQQTAKKAFDDQQRDAQNEYQQRLRDLQQALKDRIAEEKTSYQERLNAEKQSLSEALSAEKQHFNEQQRQTQEAYALQEQRNREHYQRQLDDMAAAHRDEMREIRSRGRQRLQNLQEQQKAERSEYAKHHEALLHQIQLLKNRADAIMSGQSTDTSIPAYASGGYTPNGIIRAHDREFMLNPQTTGMLERGLGGSLTQQSIQQLAQSALNVNSGAISVSQTFGAGGNPAQIEGVVRTTMLQVLREVQVASHG
jgi:hypothetical protein